MVISRSGSPVADEPGRRPQSSHSEARQSSGNPSSDTCRQEVKSRYCPFTTGDIIKNAQSNCQRHSCDCRQRLRSHGKLCDSLHTEVQCRKALTNRLTHPFTLRNFPTVLIGCDPTKITGRSASDKAFLR